MIILDEHKNTRKNSNFDGYEPSGILDRSKMSVNDNDKSITPEYEVSVILLAHYDL